MAPSKDTQEEKPQLDSVKDRYRTMDPPPCLNLDVRREKKRHKRDKDPKGNVMLKCTEVTKDEGTGEKPTCSKYVCISEPTRRNCSAISSIQTYHSVPCPKEGQELQRESLKCRAKSTEDLKNIDLCCPPEVLEDENPREPGVKRRAPEKQQLNAGDHQEAIWDHQTLKTYGDFRSPPGTIRRSQELPTLAYPPPNYTSLFLHTNPDYQCPRLGQESSQGWVIAAGVLGILGLVVLVVVGVNWWRGQRGQGKKRRSSKETLRAEEGPGEGQDGDGDGGTPGM